MIDRCLAICISLVPVTDPVVVIFRLGLASPPRAWITAEIPVAPGSTSTPLTDWLADCGMMANNRSFEPSLNENPGVLV